MLSCSKDTFCKYFIYVLTFLGVCFFIALINWCIIHFLAIYCYPTGWMGPFVSIFTMGSPICNTLNSIQLNLSNQYIIMWTSLITLMGSWLHGLIHTN